MDRYIGLDVHATSCSVGVVSPSGKHLQHMVVETNGEALVNAVRLVPGQRHVCFEEGTQSEWLYEILHPYAHEVVVTTVGGNRGQKSDKLDAFGLAEALRQGDVKPVHKGPGQFAVLRQLVLGHEALVRDVVRVMNRLKHVYRSRGASVVEADVYGRHSREQWLSQLPESWLVRALRLYEQYDALVPLRDQAEKDLAAEGRRHRIVRTLGTAPGLGPIRVARLVSRVVTPYRFRTTRQFWSYCGLGVVMRTSSDYVKTDEGWRYAAVQKTRGLNRNHVPALKAVFKGAADTVIRQLHDDPLYAHYVRLCENGTKPNLAKLTVARRIAAIVLAMWKTQEEYDPTKL